MLWLFFACAEPPTQTLSCQQYVSCLQARDVTLGITTNIDRFLPEGECWGGIEAGADLCDRACTNGLAWLQANETGLPDACFP